MKSLLSRVMIGLTGVIIAGLAGLGLSLWGLQGFDRSPTTTFAFGGSLLIYYALAPLVMSFIAVSLSSLGSGNRNQRSRNTAIIIGLLAAVSAYAVQVFGASVFNVELDPERASVILHHSIRLVILLGSAVILSKPAASKG